MTSRFPVYQIDFSAVAAGKRVAATKRRIRWRFGFPNKEALAQGRTGTDCRGDEHEIIIIWSVTSGKRQVLFDGKEIHYASSRTGIIDHSWSSKGNHVLKLVCHATTPMTANPGFRQYDLFIDGQSFFTMPKVYELGIRGINERGLPSPQSYGSGGGPSASYQEPAINVPRTRDEEEEELRRAIDASLEESRRRVERKREDPAPAPATFPAPAPATNLLHDDDLLSYSSAPTTYTQTLSSPIAAQQAQYSSPPPQQMPYYSSPPAQQLPYASPPPQPYAPVPAASQPSYQPYGGALVPSAAPSSYLSLPPTQPTGYGGPPAPPAPYAAPYGAPPPALDTSFIAPVAAPPTFGGSVPGAEIFSPAGYDDPFAPKPPTHNDVANDILKAYSQTPLAAGPTSQAALSLVGSPLPPGQPQMALAAAHGYGAPQSKAPEPEPEQLSDLEKAMRKLVNFDHIDEPAEEKLDLAKKEKEIKEAEKSKLKSRPAPPAASRVVGSGATLEQIAKVKGQKAPKEGVMNAPPQPWTAEAAAAGMLVVHGQGPPPLQQPQGFGAGFNPGYGGGYGFQPQYAAAPPPPYQYGVGPPPVQQVYPQAPQMGYQYR